jgi:hypothetical protein
VFCTALLAGCLVPGAARAQSPSSQSADEPLRFDAAVTVTAAKEPEDKQKLPVSVTAVTSDTLDRMGARIVSDAAILAPNTLYTEFTARSQSSARFRGIGGSQAISGITTYIDGVPQLRTNSSSIELVDVNQIEFVRGPQSALFGRNTLGGLVNVTSVRPSTTRWRSTASVPSGDYNAWAARASASGPVIADKLSLGVNRFSPGLFGPVAVAVHSPAELDDLGVGIFGQGTATFDERLDFTFGARYDYEDKNATLSSFYEPAIQPSTLTNGDKSFSNFSPQPGAAFRPRRDASLYGAISRGFKAGGFNASAPAGSEAFNEELAWHYEAGVKSVWMNGRLLSNAAMFYIDWDDLQTFLPNPQVPAQFYVGQRRISLEQGRRIRTERQARSRTRRLQRDWFHQRALRRREHDLGLQHLGQRHPAHTRLHGQRRRPVLASDALREHIRPCRRGLVRVVRVRRPEHDRPGCVLAHEFSCGRDYQIVRCRSVPTQRVRHSLHPGALSLPWLRAFRLSRGSRRAADVRGERRRAILRHISIIGGHDSGSCQG